MPHDLLIYLAGVPLLGILAQWVAWRLRLPSILLLLGFGIVLGQFVSPDELLASLTSGDATDEGIGPKLLFPIVSLSVAVILLEGGMTLKFSEIKEVRQDVLRLCTVGVVVTMSLSTLAGHLILGYDWRIAALFGAILTVTGPTVITPLLRHIKPSRRVSSLAKWEGIVIDPIGAILAVCVYEVVAATSAPEASGLVVVAVLAKTVAIGLGIGLASGWIMVRLIKRFLIPDFLVGVAFLAVALATFAISNVLQSEAGLVTVTALGIYLANQKHASMKAVTELKEHLVVLLISCLFIVLGSRLDLSQLPALGLNGLLFLVVLIVVIRPVAVFFSTLRSSLSWKERAFIGMLAPRGIVAAAVTSVFALEVKHLAEEHVEMHALAEQSSQLVPMVFLVIIGTVAFYGLTAGPLARFLGLAEKSPQGVLIAGAENWTRQLAKAIKEEGFSVTLVDTNYRNVAKAKMEGLTAHAASILSEYVLDEMELAGIGRLLALTPNDEVNSLATHEFAHVFGRENVYQLSPWDDRAGARRSLPESHRGRILFNGEATYYEIAQLAGIDHTVKRTRISDEFTFAQFKEKYGPTALVLFIIDQNKKLKIPTAETPLEPKKGERFIALVKEPPTEAKVT